MSRKGAGFSGLESIALHGLPTGGGQLAMDSRSKTILIFSGILKNSSLQREGSNLPEPKRKSGLAPEIPQGLMPRKLVL